jgi:hypothetical protein
MRENHNREWLISKRCSLKNTPQKSLVFLFHFLNDQLLCLAVLALKRASKYHPFPHQVLWIERERERERERRYKRSKQSPVTCKGWDRGCGLGEFPSRQPQNWVALSPHHSDRKPQSFPHRRNGLEHVSCGIWLPRWRQEDEVQPCMPSSFKLAYCVTYSIPGDNWL